MPADDADVDDDDGDDDVDDDDADDDPHIGGPAHQLSPVVQQQKQKQQQQQQKVPAVRRHHPDFSVPSDLLRGYSPNIFPSDRWEDILQIDIQ